MVAAGILPSIGYSRVKEHIVDVNKMIGGRKTKPKSGKWIPTSLLRLLLPVDQPEAVEAPAEEAQAA